MRNTSYQQYKNVQIKTANSGKLLLMLYQGCIKFLRLAKKGLEDGDYELCNVNIVKAQDIINELTNTLNRDKGKDIADDLARLYDFMNRKLVSANMNKSLQGIEIVEELMLDLLDSWEQIINKKNNNNKKEEANVNISG